MSRNNLSVYTSQKIATVTPSSGTSLVAVRVKDVILNDKHPEYSKLGKTTAIGAIKYEPITDSSREENTEELMYAYPLDCLLYTSDAADE